jgi:hypothetical protein
VKNKIQQIEKEKNPKQRDNKRIKQNQEQTNDNHTESENNNRKTNETLKWSYRKTEETIQGNKI